MEFILIIVAILVVCYFIWLLVFKNRPESDVFDTNPDDYADEYPYEHELGTTQDEATITSTFDESQIAPPIEDFREETKLETETRQERE